MFQFNNKADVFQLIKESFAKELNEEGDFWRILRRITLIDLIKLSYAKFQKENKEPDLIDIINFSLKVKLLTHLGQIKVTENPDEVFNQFNKDKEQIIKLYDEILADIKSKLSHYKDKSSFDLNNEVQYLKVINQLKIDNYSDEVFDQIICVAINLLTTKK